jgi:hypothetical protein
MGQRIGGRIEHDPAMNGMAAGDERLVRENPTLVLVRTDPQLRPKMTASCACSAAGQQRQLYSQMR